MLSAENIIGCEVQFNSISKRLLVMGTHLIISYHPMKKSWTLKPNVVMKLATSVHIML